MKHGREIMDPVRFDLTLQRLTEQIIENYSQFEELCLIGIQPRGTILLRHIVERIEKREASNPSTIFKTKILQGHLDITFYRDDFRRREKILTPSSNKMDFIIENRQVLLVDDVLYTGRTIQAALNALQHYGRPSTIKLLALIDRQFNRHLPIQCDYKGMEVDSVDNAYVRVYWGVGDAQNRVVLYDSKEQEDE
ncbi:bifunctional pyr operon transcriptional regulator/uracil phosphoribosyltransferase PyrR [Membranihabitans maritimus]|uniref:bifunctional pyr operon transcriptional regulator/uracil phosphoribosyltransferase PyrR n=1 Tax=Membranihabitans maritimus TaxID=2904244 RepID=UPI001F03230F|nr:bifunctional pyr operon transcriptional regulator/uracil phosphoribosyltransferase PyrR [Membranihabitans maritimus]